MSVAAMWRAPGLALALGAFLVAGCGGGSGADDGADGAGEAATEEAGDSGTEAPTAFVQVQGSLGPEPSVGPVVVVGEQTLMQAPDASTRVRGWDDSGELLFDVTVDAASVPELPDQPRAFSAVASFPGPAARLARVELTLPEGEPVDRVASLPETEFTRALEAPDAITAERTTEGPVRVAWDPELFEVVVIRESASGQVLGIGRGGEALVTTEAGELTVAASEGVRSGRREVTVR